MVVVPVDDEHPPEAVDPLGIARRDRGIAVEAETLPDARVVRVVPGRPAGAEGVLDLSASHRVHRPEGARNGELGNRTRHLDAANRLHVLGRVMGSNGGQGILRQREWNQLLVETSLGEHLHHPNQTKGSLGMHLTPAKGEHVIQIAGVVDQPGACGRLPERWSLIEDGVLSEGGTPPEGGDRSEAQQPLRSAGNEFSSCLHS